jgi:hypothetical protein
MTSVIWTRVAEVMPDSDTTVMIFDPTADEPVWLGYFDGEAWRAVDGMQAHPTHWMDLPEGPNK